MKCQVHCLFVQILGTSSIPVLEAGQRIMAAGVTRLRLACLYRLVINAFNFLRMAELRLLAFDQPIGKPCTVYQLVNIAHTLMQASNAFKRLQGVAPQGCAYLQIAKLIALTRQRQYCSRRLRGNLRNARYYNRNDKDSRNRESNSCLSIAATVSCRSSRLMPMSDGACFMPFPAATAMPSAKYVRSPCVCDLQKKNLSTVWFATQRPKRGDEKGFWGKLLELSLLSWGVRNGR